MSNIPLRQSFLATGQFPGEAALRAVGVGLLITILSIIRVLAFVCWRSCAEAIG
jgi:hypothetical protein